MAPGVPAAGRVRPIGPGDRDAVIALWRGLFDAHAETEHRLAGWRGDGPRLDAAIAAWVRGILDGTEGFGFVAEREGEILGFIAGFVRDEGWLDPPRRGVVGALAVIAPARRRGLGRALLGAAEGWFAREGVAVVEAGIGAANGVAQRFWAAAGYADIRRIAARGLRA